LIFSSVALGWSLLTITILHVISAHNPVLDTLSSYAYTDKGTGMLAASILALAVGSIATLIALISAGVPVSKTTIFLFGTWSLGLTTAALFPASYPPNPNPLSGDIHQYSCVIAFLSLPAIGISLLERLRELPALERERGTLTRLTLISAGSVLLFGASYIIAALKNVPIVGDLAIALPVGFAQRVSLLADFVLLAWLVLLASRVAAGQKAANYHRQLSQSPQPVNQVHQVLSSATPLGNTHQVALIDSSENYLSGISEVYPASTLT
jgi:hypothetical protein